jgi:hypothetical protein
LQQKLAEFQPKLQALLKEYGIVIGASLEPAGGGLWRPVPTLALAPDAEISLPQAGDEEAGNATAEG